MFLNGLLFLFFGYHCQGDTNGITNNRRNDRGVIDLIQKYEHILNGETCKNCKTRIKGTKSKQNTAEIIEGFGYFRFPIRSYKVFPYGRSKHFGFFNTK